MTETMPLPSATETMPLPSATETMTETMTETEPIISEVNEVNEEDFKYIPTEK